MSECTGKIIGTEQYVIKTIINFIDKLTVTQLIQIENYVKKF